MAQSLQRGIFNQCALKGLDPHFKELVSFSAFVAIYKFSPSENQWKQSEVEGTLFVYARSRKPSFNILVLNRLSLDKFEETICGELILLRREPFLFYVTPSCTLYAIWFHDIGDCLRVTYQIEGLKRQLTADPVTDDDWSDIPAFKSLMEMSESRRNSGRMAPGAKKSGNGDGKSFKKPEKGKSRIAAQLYPLGGGNSGPSAHANKSKDDKEKGAAPVRGVAGKTANEDEHQTPKSVVDFFARAGFTPVNPQARLMSQMSAGDSERATVNPVVKQIVTNPCHSLKHVEKQQMTAKSQQPQAGSSQKPKTARSQKPKAANTQKSKEDGTQKPKEGEGKSSKSDPPRSIVEFLNRLKISRSANPGPGGRMDEIPDILPLIPQPPTPNLDSIPRPFRPAPIFPGWFGPVEAFDFVPDPVNGSGPSAGSSRPLPAFPKPDLGIFHPVPPKPLASVPEAPAHLPPTPEPPVKLSSVQEPPVLLSQAPEPPPPLPQTSEPPAPLSPTPDPPMPLSSILKNTRRSVRPNPTLHKPVPLVPKPSEPSSSSAPPPMFPPKNSQADVKYNDYNGQASAAVAGNKADEDNGGVGIGIGIGNINLNDIDQEGGTAAPNPLPHTQSHDFNVDTLTRDQLLQAVHHLLQNDPGFIRKIHEAYLKSLNESFP